jgi:hypothetical protein
VDYHLTKESLTLPEWVRESPKNLFEPWTVSPYTDVSEVPAIFRQHGVLLVESELASAIDQVDHGGGFG